MKKIATLSLILPILLLTCSLVSAEPQILDMASGTRITFSEMIQDLQGSNLNSSDKCITLYLFHI